MAKYIRFDQREITLMDEIHRVTVYILICIDNMMASAGLQLCNTKLKPGRNIMYFF